MSKILIKVAAEINVGKENIVEFLTKKGFEIESKPNAKITDDMYSELLKEFSSSIAIKEKADQLIIGTRPTVKKEVPVAPVVNTPKVAPKVVLKEETPEVVEKAPEVPKVVEPPVEVIFKPEAEEKARPQLKILGKINLDAKKPEPKVVPKKVEDTPKQTPTVTPKPTPPPAPVEKVKEEVKVEEKPVEKVVVAPVVVPEPVVEAPEGDDEYRAETPTLKGLKILGKIDTDKFNKKPKIEVKPETKGPRPPGQSTMSEEERKRKRKRKKIPADNPTGGGQGQNRPGGQQGGGQGQNRPGGQQGGGQQGGGQGQNRQFGGQGQNRPGGQQGGGQNRPAGGGTPNQASNQPAKPQRKINVITKKAQLESKEVSKKEIEDQIKATMARLSVGGKSKRQKIRRDKRDEMREKQEAKDLQTGDSKLQVQEFISVSELASLMNVNVTEVIMTCMNLGYMVSINQRLDAEIIEVVASEFNHEIEFISAEDLVSADEVEDADDLLPDDEDRAPIVAVMGHVDHGKTSLLDYIRNANVVSGEAGGITQHIGAYEVVHNNKKITFLDTPGHEAFTAMRARGAKVTDVAVIIIAADDSIMPQTKEAISHAQAAGVPIIFAINKIDKEGADPGRIKQELASMNLLVEEWGGKYQSQDISAKKGLNVDLLLEKILLEAELLDVKANSKKRAIGTVIEASLDKGKGYVTKILVQNGTLSIGDPMVAGEFSGKVKAMYNERGQRVKSVGPSSPVLVLGLGGAPQAGEKFKVMSTDAEARQIASKRSQITREQSNRASKRISLEEIGRRLALGTFKELNLIVKGDVDGSIEALADSLIKLSVESVQVNVIHKAVGQIVESDVLLASASDAIIVGFQVRPSMTARKLAEREGVEIKMYSIIYEAIDEIKSAIEGLLEPTKEEKLIGQIEIREVYKISKIGTIAGCYVIEGKFTRNTPIRVIRDGIVIFPTKEGATGTLGSLKRYKDDVKEVKTNMECGITINNFNDIKEGDIVEGYEIIEVKQKLD